MGEPVIQFDQVSKCYRRETGRGSLRDAIPAALRKLASRQAEADRLLWALKDVSFTVQSGETLGIVGPNGAGKTTILKLLSHVTSPTHGRIRLDGKAAALIELGAGFHPDLTGRENVYLNATILGLKKDEIRARFDSIVAFAGLESFIDMPVKRYSSGMYVRLGFAVAAHVDADVLLIDEVLAVGDHFFQDKCIQRLVQLRQECKTFIIVSHDRQKIERLCDRALLLRHGEVAAQGNVGDVLREYHRVRGEDGRAASHQADAEAPAPRELEILHVTMMDRQRRKCYAFESGDPAIVRIAFQTTAPVRQPIFYTRIYRDDGLFVHSTHTAQCGVRLDFAAPTRGVVELVYESLALLEGSYRLDVGALRSLFSPLTYDEIQGACRLVMRSTLVYEDGVVRIPHTWQLLDQSP